MKSRCSAEGEPKPLSMEEIRWVKKSWLGELDFLEAARPFIADLVGGVA